MMYFTIKTKIVLFLKSWKRANNCSKCKRFKKNSNTEIIFFSQNPQNLEIIIWTSIIRSIQTRMKEREKEKSWKNINYWLIIIFFLSPFPPLSFLWHARRKSLFIFIFFSSFLHHKNRWMRRISQPPLQEEMKMNFI